MTPPNPHPDHSAMSEQVRGEGGDWHRGWHISKSFFGYWFQHPGFDPENATDWRHGYAATVQDARDEIDSLLADDAEWTAASAALRSAAEAARAQVAS